MGATEEQMAAVAASGIDHVAYILILYSIAFILFLFVNVLVYVYDRTANAATIKRAVGRNGTVVAPNGRIRLNSTRTDDGNRLRDVEEFELDGMLSDDEDEEQAARRKLLPEEGGSEEGLGSPNTVGRNSDRVA
jgi:hypothetical protein